MFSQVLGSSTSTLGGKRTLFINESVALKAALLLIALLVGTQKRRLRCLHDGYEY